MRRFHLYRTEDVTGVSGVGVVAEGIEWEDRAITMRWRGKHRSTVHWDAAEGIAAVEVIHGHGGATRVEWLDP